MMKLKGSVPIRWVVILMLLLIASAMIIAALQGQAGNATDIMNQSTVNRLK